MTTKPEHRTPILIGLMILGLIAATVWSHGRLIEHHAAAVTAASDLAACRRLAAGLLNLTQRPARVQSQPIGLNEMTRHIEQSTKQAHIAPDSLVRIWPDPPVRIGQTPYHKKSTQVLFRHVTLRQVITFLHTLATKEGGPQPTRLRLLAAGNGQSRDRWTAESTLTYLTYTPQPRPTGRRSRMDP